MADSVAGVVLAAGAGTRLAPLTRLRPKALLPVGGRALVDLAIARAASVVGADTVAVNVHHHRSAMESHLAGRVRVSVEPGEARGTAGALALLRDWIDGRDVLVANADAFLVGDVAGFADGWDRQRSRLLCVRVPGPGDFGDLRYCGLALVPWADVVGLTAEPSGLYEVLWRAAGAAGRIDLVEHPGAFVDCGTPADYLAANMLSSGGLPVVGEGAVVGPGAVLDRAVVWDGARVAAGEELRGAVRADGGVTVLVR